MTFKDVVLKNFKGSFKKYLAYFLCSSFSIMIFFMYSTLIFNKELSSRDDTEVLSYVFSITIVAIALFSVFFINYAHAAFIKGRNKEFGIYITLGMDANELKYLINIENIIISSLSLTAGMSVGALFSRLFQMIILSLLDVDNVSYYLDYKAVFFTLGVFLIIFILVFIITSFKMRKLDITSLLREARRSEGRKYSNVDKILGCLGIVIMICSVIYLIIIAQNEELNTNSLILMSYMGVAFTGVYLTISYGGNLIIHLVKKSRYYYKNILAITEIHYKFNQNKKIIFILSVLSTMTIFLVASPFSLYSLSESIAEMNKNHLEFVETRNINTIAEDKLAEILNIKKIRSNVKLKFLYLSTSNKDKSISSCKPIVSVDEYNSLTKNNIELEIGEATNIILDWIPGTHGIEPGNNLTLYDDNFQYDFKIKDSKRGNWVAGLETFQSNSIIVINNEDYIGVANNITNDYIGYYHLINFKNWKNCKEEITKLKDTLGQNDLKIISIIDKYESLKKGYSVFLFVSTVMGILFFVAGGSVLYFKQYTELTESQVTFNKLFKIGITDKEMKEIISKELIVIFFLPLIFGSFLGVSLIYLMTYIVGGDAIIKEFISNAFIVVAVYFMSQGIFYMITMRKYLREVYGIMN